LRHLSEFQLRATEGRHFLMVCRSAAWKDGESNSSTTSGRSVLGREWLSGYFDEHHFRKDLQQLGRGCVELGSKADQDLIVIAGGAPHSG